MYYVNRELTGNFDCGIVERGSLGVNAVLSIERTCVQIPLSLFSSSHIGHFRSIHDPSV